MNWPWRVVIIVPAASKSLAEQAARAINSTGPDYVGEAFSVALSADGSLPATHFGLATSATDDMVSRMADALPGISGVQYWRHDAAGVLVSSNITAPLGHGWGWAESLSAAGLSQILPPLE